METDEILVERHKRLVVSVVLLLSAWRSFIARFKRLRCYDGPPSLFLFAFCLNLSKLNLPPTSHADAPVDSYETMLTENLVENSVKKSTKIEFKYSTLPLNKFTLTNLFIIKSEYGT